MLDKSRISHFVQSLDARPYLHKMLPRSDRQVSIQIGAAVVGIIGVEFAEILPQGSIQNSLAVLGFVGLLAAAAFSLVISRSRSISPRPEIVGGVRPVAWRWTILGLGLFGALATQTWFQSGTAFAVGDTTPPIGTAWIGRLFASFSWSGVTLGAPVNNQVWLPWAFVDWVTHSLGGSGALAQRIWFSLLVAAILMAAGALARSLQFSPMAGVVVALLYFYNPMTMSEAGANTIFLAAMALMAALAAVVISYGLGHIKLWHVCLAFVVAAPLVGYTYNNPPLVLMLVISTCATPLLVLLGFGRSSAMRSIWSVLIGGALLIGASAYWLIPSLSTLATVATGSISTLSAWGFTESRSTLANALWLNTTWAWLPVYFPVAPDFGNFPLDLVRPLVPMVAFSGLIIKQSVSDLDRCLPRLRGLLSLMVLFLIFLSTGTRLPGSLLFDPLYRLPFGWLLREPGRFLMIAALGYALLGGLLVQQLETSSSRWHEQK